MVDKRNVYVILAFVLLSLFIFRDYSLKNFVPFPANLLVALYEPWASYEWEGYPNGPPTRGLGADNLRIFYPLRKLGIEQVRAGEWPIWNPYNFAGNTLLATYQTAVFHPLSFLFLILPQIDAWSVIIILSPILAGIFMYIFLREISLSRKASFFGSLTFAFSGFMIVWYEESFMSVYSSLFLPLILYAIERMLKKITAFNFLLLTLGLALSIFSGWFQMTLYVWFFAFAWFMYRWLTSQRDKRLIMITLTGYILAFLISTVHLLPSIEAYLYSARGTTDAKFLFDIYLQPIQHLISYLVPDFFGNPAAYNYFGSHGFYHEKMLFIGIPAFIFALYALLIKKRENYEMFYKIAWFVTLSLGFALPTTWVILYHLKLPFLSTIVPSRIFILATVCSSILAAFGFDKYMNNPEKKKIITILIILSIIFIALWAFVGYQFIFVAKSQFATVGLRNLIVASIFFVVTSTIVLLGVRKGLRRYTFATIIFISIISIAYFANKYLYFSDRKMLFPQTPVLEKIQMLTAAQSERFWSYGKGYIDRNFATYYRIFSADGYDSFFIGRYGELIFAAENNGYFTTQISRADVKLPQTHEFKGILANPYRERLLSLLGVRYIVASKKDKDDPLKDRERDNDLELIWEDDFFGIYEYKKALPRAFLVSGYTVETHNQSIFDKIFNRDFDLSQDIILEEEPLGFERSNDKEGDAKIIAYKPNSVAIKTNAKSDKLLFLSDNYFPGWKAYIDDAETRIYRANYSFRAAVVPKGLHSVTFEYEPEILYKGALVTGVGIILLVVFCVALRLKLIRV